MSQHHPKPIAEGTAAVCGGGSYVMTTQAMAAQSSPQSLFDTAMFTVGNGVPVLWGEAVAFAGAVVGVIGVAAMILRYAVTLAGWLRRLAGRFRR